jgi:hypothetical protein
MRQSSFIEMHWCSHLLDTQIMPCHCNLAAYFKHDLSRVVIEMTLMRQSSLIEMHWCSHLLGHLDRALSLCNLGSKLSTRFQQSGDRDDLDEAIQLHRDALVLRPPGHPARAMSLSTLQLTGCKI